MNKKAQTPAAGGTPVRKERPVHPVQRGRPTLGMVAERAGVSPSTVSRILNGTAKVSAEKRALVESMITELGFKPDPVARSLAGGLLPAAPRRRFRSIISPQRVTHGARPRSRCVRPGVRHVARGTVR